MSEEKKKDIQPERRRESFADMDKSITHERPEPVDVAPTERPSQPVDQSQQND